MNEHDTPPMYVFVTNQEKVCWDDAMLAWVTLYHRIGNDKEMSKGAIIRTLKAIKQLTKLSMAYSRWDNKKGKFIKFTAA